MSKAPQLIKLMERGYFPKELPPCFSTHSLAKSLLGKTELLGKLDEQVKQHKHSYFVPFSIPKWSGFRRRLSIPHPLFATALSKEVCENWQKILRNSNKSPLSKSRIKIGGEKDSRYLLPSIPPKELGNIRIEYAATARYVLHADIANYYPSVYTHILPWCLHGKKTSRRKMSDYKMVGNKIDKGLRGLQHDESFGLPIGLDACFAISEVIGSTIDWLLCKQLKNKRISYSGYRYVDDFVLYFNSEHDSKVALEQLRHILAELRLTLNEEKTFIKRLPEAIEQPWTFEISKFRFDSPHQITDIKHFFAIAFNAQSIYPKDPVLSYALKVLIPTKKHKLDPNRAIEERNWEKFLALVCQAIITKPESIRQAFTLLEFYRKRIPIANNPEWKILEKAVNHLIETSSPNDDYELSWCLWFIRHFEFTLTTNAANIVSQSSNSIVILMALDLMQSAKLPPNTFDTVKWKSILSIKDATNSSNWLLYYECSVKKWLGLNRSSLKQHYWLNLLSQARVEFFRKSTPKGTASGKSSDTPTSEGEEDFVKEWYDSSINAPTSY